MPGARGKSAKSGSKSGKKAPPPPQSEQRSAASASAGSNEQSAGSIDTADTIDRAELREPLPEQKDFNVRRFIVRHIKAKLYDDAAHTKPSTIDMKYEVGELAALCNRAKEAFKAERTLVEVPAPCTIIGDIHGQFGDMLRIFYAVGWPHQQRMLFLGDYIDRGDNNLECAALCLAYKVLYPRQIFLLRGNHEWRPVNAAYGFWDELQRRFSKVTAMRLFNAFNAVFDWMPLAAVVAGRILAMHGGIGPQLKSWDDIRNIERPIMTPTGLAQDLLWADPDVNNRVTAFGPNAVRGVSYIFGKKPIEDVCRALDVDIIVRAHQLVQDGYEFYGNKLVTVFSAPKYCNEFDNTAGIMHVDIDLRCFFTLLKPLVAPPPTGRSGGKPASPQPQLKAKAAGDSRSSASKADKRKA